MRSKDAIDRIVIIGGGISGLSSAFYLQKEAERQGRSVSLTIVEASDSLGGKINTLRKDGFVIEKGPDSFLARKTAIIDLAKELGIEGELTGTNPNAKKTYIMRDKKLHAMPPGLVLGIPTEIRPFLKSGLLSWGGKLRALQDMLLPARPSEQDESLGGFLERRLGTEVMRRIAEPLLAGIYAGDLKKLSLQATFPQFAASEKKYGSLIKGMKHNRRTTAAAAAAAGAERQSSAFLTFKGGLTTLVKELEKALSAADKRLGVRVAAIERAEDGYRLKLSDSSELGADRIVMTAPAFAAAALLESHVDCDMLRQVRYVSVANVVMAFDKAAFPLDFDGSGFLVPRSEGLHITACTWTSSKWLHSSPENKVLLRCYVGHSEDQESVKLPDEELIAAVRRDVELSMGIKTKPLFTEMTRLNASMPQYPVGHLEHIKKFRGALAQKLPGVWVTGAAFDGVGLPDCIRQGKEAAAAILSQ
ncbi:protoporphyrinogen oxidase [Paenibacillus sp. HB172176]|uniref:protoporphyrinogen oxidase n=1 Tax=Paenibacillus sp. HB172176 TaxID=2493690 RepID=UPI001439BCA1|nr:protoporphyrinogen oxidase [Paenibacillus sp. HB172176]